MLLSNPRCKRYLPMRRADVMALKFVFLLCVCAWANACYWNEECSYPLYSSKTPYDAVRGDIRDAVSPTSCDAVGIWSLHRHGNRNPGTTVTDSVKKIADLKDEILRSYNAGASLLCAEDIDMFKAWTWNGTLESSQSFLTGTGYKELYAIGKRLREKYPHLVTGAAENFYFRPTNEQRTITSGMAFIHGLTDETGLDLPLEDALPIDDVIRPYEKCDRYQQDVKGSQILTDTLLAYYQTPQFIEVQKAVQLRLGIEKILSADEIYAMYELCRFDRSWNEVLRSPWCAPFSRSDLVVLEYRDDLRHYYRNGHGSWVNERLGRIPLKDLLQKMDSLVHGTGGAKKFVSYFTHDTMLEMVYSALNLYQDKLPLQPHTISENRLWKTSYIGNFAVNFIVVLNNCSDSRDPTSFKVQLFINEKETELCPTEGCSWEEFMEKFGYFEDADLSFCYMDVREPEALVTGNNSAENIPVFSTLLLIQIAFLVLRR